MLQISQFTRSKDFSSVTHKSNGIFSFVFQMLDTYLTSCNTTSWISLRTKSTEPIPSIVQALFVAQIDITIISYTESAQTLISRIHIGWGTWVYNSSSIQCINNVTHGDLHILPMAVETSRKDNVAPGFFYHYKIQALCRSPCGALAQIFCMKRYPINFAHMVQFFVWKDIQFFAHMAVEPFYTGQVTQICPRSSQEGYSVKCKSTNGDLLGLYTQQGLSLQKPLSTHLWLFSNFVYRLT